MLFKHFKQPGNHWRILDPQEGLMEEVEGPETFKVYWFLLGYLWIYVFLGYLCRFAPGQPHLC